MENKEYAKRINDLNSQIEALKHKKTSLRNTFLSEYNEFKIGDKVKVFETSWNNEERFRFDAFISRVHDDGYTGKPHFDFVGIKKDGTPSLKSAGYVWRTGTLRIELLNKEPTVQVSDTTMMPNDLNPDNQITK